MFKFFGTIGRKAFLWGSALRTGLFVASFVGAPFLIVVLHATIDCRSIGGVCGALSVTVATEFRPLVFCRVHFVVCGYRDAARPRRRNTWMDRSHYPVAARGRLQVPGLFSGALGIYDLFWRPQVSFSPLFAAGAGLHRSAWGIAAPQRQLRCAQSLRRDGMGSAWARLIHIGLCRFNGPARHPGSSAHCSVVSEIVDTRFGSLALRDDCRIVTLARGYRRGVSASYVARTFPSLDRHRRSDISRSFPAKTLIALSVGVALVTFQFASSDLASLFAPFVRFSRTVLPTSLIHDFLPSTMCAALPEGRICDCFRASLRWRFCPSAHRRG